MLLREYPWEIWTLQEITSAYHVMEALRQHGKRVFGLIGQDFYNATPPSSGKRSISDESNCRSFWIRKAWGKLMPYKAS